MSYTKQNFKSGDILYASQLNAMDTEIATLESEVNSTKNMVGHPYTAATASAMSDQTKIYVYTGSETGYTAGHWYYYNGTAWTDGGVYNSVAVNTDTSLTVSGQAADSKAVGDAIDEMDSDLSDVKETLSDLDEDLHDELDDVLSFTTATVGKNKYNREACGPSDNHVYSSNGSYTESTYFATTGKIPVEASTQYAFSVGSASVRTVRYFSGTNGETFISGADIYDGIFTTPSNCTYIAINIFGAVHTTEQYESAMAVAQLEEGSAPTSYEPYRIIRTISLDSIEGGQDVVDLMNTFVPTVGKNLYDPSVCKPSNNYVYSSSGAYTASTSFATTGKIPVSPSTQYIFSAGSAAVKTVRYFSGVDGGTYISGGDLNGAFTTPNNCTFIAINLFGGSHTEAQYETAIANAQLERGSIVTPYEPYMVTPVLPARNIENGSVLEEVSSVMEEQSQINLYDKTLAENGKYVSGATVGTSDVYAYTGAVPVKPSTQYNLSTAETAPMTISTTINEYDANGTFLRSKQTSRGQFHVNPFVTDADTYYIKVNMILSGHTEQDFLDTINTMMLCYGVNRPDTYSAFDKTLVVPNRVLGNAFFDNFEKFTGKKWIALGTSITWYDGQGYEHGVPEGTICRGYVGYVAGRKKLIVDNQGVSGSTLGNVNASSLINRYASVDWSGADIVTIEYGVNDYGYDIPVGTESDAAGTSTFSACLKTVIEYALAQNPKICLVICTDPDVRGAAPNGIGKTLQDYTDMTIAIANQYRLPICDWFYRSGINDLNRGDREKDWMTIDGTHPSNAGHNRMAAILNQVFDSLIC